MITETEAPTTFVSCVSSGNETDTILEATGTIPTCLQLLVGNRPVVRQLWQAMGRNHAAFTICDKRGKKRYNEMHIVSKSVLSYAKFQVLTAESMKTAVLWDVPPCSLVKTDRRFRGAYRLHLQGDASSMFDPWFSPRWDEWDAWLKIKDSGHLIEDAGTARHGMVWYSTIQYNTAHSSTVQLNVVQYNTAHSSIVFSCSTVLHTFSIYHLLQIHFWLGRVL
jgi:hypothetical protein